PPCMAASSLSRRSATRRFIAAAFLAKSGDSGSMAVCGAVMVVPHHGRSQDNQSYFRSASPRLVEQLPADQHAPDLAGAGADLVELGVAQIASGRVVVDVAVAAEQLYGIERDLGGVLGGVEDRAGGVLAGGFAAVAGFRHGID